MQTTIINLLIGKVKEKEPQQLTAIELQHLFTVARYFAQTQLLDKEL